MDVVSWFWFSGIFLMEAVDGISSIFQVLNKFFSSIFNWPSSLFHQVFELLLRCCWLGVEDFFNLKLFISILTNDKARACIELSGNRISWC